MTRSSDLTITTVTRAVVDDSNIYMDRVPLEFASATAVWRDEVGVTHLVPPAVVQEVVAPALPAHIRALQIGNLLNARSQFFIPSALPEFHAQTGSSYTVLQAGTLSFRKPIASGPRASFNVCDAQIFVGARMASASVVTVNLAQRGQIQSVPLRREALGGVQIFDVRSVSVADVPVSTLSLDMAYDARVRASLTSQFEALRPLAVPPSIVPVSTLSHLGVFGGSTVSTAPIATVSSDVTTVSGFKLT